MPPHANNTIKNDGIHPRAVCPYATLFTVQGALHSLDCAFLTRITSALHIHGSFSTPKFARHGS